MEVRAARGSSLVGGVVAEGFGLNRFGVSWGSGPCRISDLWFRALGLGSCFNHLSHASPKPQTLELSDPLETTSSKPGPESQALPNPLNPRKNADKPPKTKTWSKPLQ